ncbi:hypothetical protein GW17_00037250 [Ensete ventricosum]|nr:hypothetical protein GW17_00037250 [Ensete ventricosum]
MPGRRRESYSFAAHPSETCLIGCLDKAIVRSRVGLLPSFPVSFYSFHVRVVETREHISSDRKMKTKEEWQMATKLKRVSFDGMKRSVDHHFAMDACAPCRRPLLHCFDVNLPSSNAFYSVK